MTDWYDDNLLFDPTPDLIVQYCTMHHGKVVDVNDPECRGRVRLEIPGLLGEGKENWSDWVEMSSTPIGGIKKSKGDQGAWIPMQPGQSALMGFLSGDPFAYFAIPAPACQKEKNEGTQLTPLEAKIAGKDNPRDATRIFAIKDPAGNTLFYDFRGKKEKFAVMNWVGEGLFFVCPGKEEDEKDQDGEESKERKGKSRGLKCVANGTAPKPSEICRDGFSLIALLGLMGQGQVQTASDDYGLRAEFVRGKDGKITVSALYDGSLPRLYLTAGDVQIQLRGDKGDIAVTRQEIKELDEKAPVEDVIEKLLETPKKEFEELKEEQA